jgi:hypothetical protein
MFMKRTVASVLVVLLTILCAATAAHADAGFRTPAVASRSPLSALWNWLSTTALPWLTEPVQPSPATAVKELPPPPHVQPMNGACTDPDGARVPCAPIL